MPPAPPRGPTPGRLLGLYALSVMEREGPLYGYQLSARVAERTSGGWRPGPGAVYPALGRLVDRKLAVRARSGPRQVYRITPEGRRLLRAVRRGRGWRQRHGPELGLLWAELAGEGDPGRFLEERIRSLSDRFVEYLASGAVPLSQRRAHGARLLGELRVRSRAIETFLARRAPAAALRRG